MIVSIDADVGVLVDVVVGDNFIAVGACGHFWLLGPCGNPQVQVVIHVHIQHTYTVYPLHLCPISSLKGSCVVEMPSSILGQSECCCDVSPPSCGPISSKKPRTAAPDNSGKQPENKINYYYSGQYTRMFI